MSRMQPGTQQHKVRVWGREEKRREDSSSPSHPLSSLSPRSMVAALRFGKCTEVRKSRHTETPKKSCTIHTQLILSLKMYQVTQSPVDSTAKIRMRMTIRIRIRMRMRMRMRMTMRMTIRMRMRMTMRSKGRLSSAMIGRVKSVEAKTGDSSVCIVHT